MVHYTFTVFEISKVFVLSYIATPTYQVWCYCNIATSTAADTVSHDS